MRRRWAVPVVALLAVPVAGAGADPLPGGTFDPYVAYSRGPSYQAVATGLLNGDGSADVAVAVPRELHIFPGDGTGALGAATVYPLFGYWTRSVAVGDFNGDGRADAAVTTQSQVELFTQTAAGTMAAAGLLTVEAEKVRIADVTADGRDDVIVIGWDRDAVRVYPQTAAGSIGVPVDHVVPLSGYNDLDVGDVDGDGDNDIVAMNGQLYATPDLTVLIQRPGGMDIRSYLVPGGNVNASGVGLGDVDGDGLGEVVVSHGGNSSSKVTVYEAAADGMLTEGATIGVYDIPEPVEVADYDLDGYDDAAIAHGGWHRISVLYGSSSGLSQVAEPLPAPYASHYEGHGLVSGDLDDDGDAELVVSDYNNGVLVYRNRGAGVPKVADLNLALASPATVKANAVFTQTLIVRNQGNLAMSGSVRIDVPSALKLQATPAGCALAGLSLTCAVPSLPAGASHAVLVTVKAPKPGSATTRATLLSSSIPDSDATDNVATVSVSITKK